jgi:ribosomal protein L19
MSETDFKEYQRKQIAELRAYQPGERLSDRVSISEADREAGSPKEGDMIARNPADHEDQWLVSKEYFEANFEPID